MAWRDQFEATKTVEKVEGNGTKSMIPYEIKQFYVTIRLDEEQGTAMVEENITYTHFERFKRHTRIIPLDGHKISNVSVKCKEIHTGVLLQQKTEDNQVRLSWTFPEASSELNFTLKYKVYGCMRYHPSQTLDEFSWNCLTPYIQAPIKYFQVHVYIPAYRGGSLYSNYWTLNNQPKSRMLIQYDKTPRLVFRKDTILKCDFVGVYLSWINRKKFEEKDRASQNAIVQALYEKQLYDPLSPYQNEPSSIPSLKEGEFLSSLPNASSLESEAKFLRDSIVDEHIEVLNGNDHETTSLQRDSVIE